MDTTSDLRLDIKILETLVDEDFVKRRGIKVKRVKKISLSKQIISDLVKFTEDFD